MFIEHIQSLIVDVVKVNWGGGSRKTHLYTKPYMKRMDVFYMPHGY